MKKKFIAVYALIGVLALGSTALTSCVDDNESASVTAIRDAKAAQLNALAAYQNAQAESEKIIAEAEAAIRNAEAEAKRIANELQDLALQKAQATLATDIETAKAEAEAALLRQQANLEQEKANLISALDNVSIAEKNRIQNLMWQAEVELNNINTYQQQIINAESNRISAQYNLANAQLQKDEAISWNNQQIAVQQALIEEYKKYDNGQIADAEKAYNESYAKQEALYAEYQNKKQEVYPLKEASTTLYNNVNASLLMEIQNTITSVSSYIVVDNENTPQSEEIVITYDDGTSSIVTKGYGLDKYKIDEDAVKAGIDDQITAQNRQIAIATAALNEANKALTDKKAEQGYKDAQKAVTDAQAAFDKATTEADKQTALLTLQTAETTLANYATTEENNVKNAENRLESLQTTLESYQEMKNWLDNSGYAEYEALYQSYIESVDKWYDAYIEQQKIWHNYTVQTQLTTILQQAMNSTVDFSEEINDCQETINNLTAQNEDLSNIQTQEALVKYYEQQKAQYEQYLSIAQANYDEYIAQIQDLIENGSQLPDVPATDTPATDTPAEGEETPAA